MMPRKNRVTPFGEIISVPARGTLMGNRGCLHDAHGNVTKNTARIAWVTCLLEFKGRRRQVMAPGQYTELFFLDEATALASGHRPCATCQRARYDEFKRGWTQANPGMGSEIEEIDRHLQGERLASGGSAWCSKMEDLANGVFVAEGENPNAASLHWGSALYPWTPSSYKAPFVLQPSARVQVITPRSVCRMMATGFKARLHVTAQTRQQ